ncbi:hypothetical protein GOARA_036_00760 [Gordonia araii NBRC 100433]|uniref:DUF5642 domain-containing protein n=2 Tax=Gordonia araii TaxID=263909 RepID=G7H0G9_9ACTN|nr:hypothetical protein GOARA_036_00760 [Gordonia araii NBRC 100433]
MSSLAVMALAAITMSACAIDGDPHDSLVHRSVDPAAFPVEQGTDVTPVPPGQLTAIVGDITGHPVGAQIVPPDCAPQQISPAPTSTVVQTGFGRPPAPGAPPPAYTTVITRTGDSLDDVAATVGRCAEYRRSAGVEVLVTQRVLAQVPSVRRATTVGYSRTEATPGAGQPVTTTLLVAQRGNVRVYATRRAVGADQVGREADSALIRLFEAATAAGLR